MIRYNEIIELNNSKLKYVLRTPRIKDSGFALTLTSLQIEENVKAMKGDVDAYMRELYEIDQIIIKIVEEHDGLMKSLRYISMPTFEEKKFELIPIAKGVNSGNLFIFSNNKDYLEAIIKTNKKLKINN